MREIVITTEYIKLDSFLKLANAVSSGGEAKILITQGSVLVDGQPCLMRGKKIREGMQVSLGGESFLCRNAQGIEGEKNKK